MLTINLDRTDENADWLHALRSQSSKNILKTKIYLEPNEKPPEGVHVKRGPRGGLYYDAKVPIIKPEEIRPVKIKVDPALRENKYCNAFLDEFERSKNLLDQLETLSFYKKIFDTNVKDSDPELYKTLERMRHALYRHVKFVIRQHELEKLGKAHVDIKLFQHKIKLFNEVKNAEESLDTVSKVLHSCKLSTGCNETKKMQFSNKGTIDAIFKPLKGEYRGIRSGVDTLYNREVCAYNLDQLFGLNLVPETVYKTVKGKIGSAQKWVHGTKEPYTIDASKLFVDDVIRITLFDYLISNTDRHSANYLLKLDPKINKYRIIAIDNGCCLSTSDYNGYWQIFRSFYSKDFTFDHKDDDFKEIFKDPKVQDIVNNFVSVPWTDIKKILIKHKIPDRAIELCKMKFDLLKKLKRLPTMTEVKDAYIEFTVRNI